MLHLGRTRKTPALPGAPYDKRTFKEDCADRAALSAEDTTVSLPKTSSMQLMLHVDTHEAPRRVGRVAGFED